MGDPTRHPNLYTGRWLRPLLGATIAALSLTGGVAIAGTGGIAAGPPPPEPPPAACQGGSSSSAPQSFNVQHHDAAPAVKYYGDDATATLSYEIGGATQPVDLAVHVLNLDSGVFVRSYCPENVSPGAQETVQWDTKTDQGTGAPKGRYEYVLTELDGTPVDDSGASGDPQFQFRGHIFPLQASHRYGDGWGAGRGHRGIDLFEAASAGDFSSPCGAPIVAARAGKVQWKAYQSGGAGHYIVIDGNGTNRDYVYMHLQAGTINDFVSKGDSVLTGQQIGTVGRSGNPSACHLHFELWNGDWYGGGYAYDPEPSVRNWDSWSGLGSWG